MRIKGKILKWTILLPLILFFGLPMVYAQPGEQSPLVLKHTDGTIYVFNRLQVGSALSEVELEKIRGGFAGMSFAVYFSGYWNNLGASEGTLAFEGAVTSGETDINTFPLPEVISNDSQTHVQITSVVGGLENARGVFQFSQISGDYNIVSNYLTLQIAIINVVNENNLPSISALFR